jgi:hypothetical protein
MAIILAALGGLVAGVPLTLYPFLMAYAVAYHVLWIAFPSLPRDPSAHQFLVFNLCFYAIWCGAVTLLATSARAPKWLLAFLLTVPLPSIYIAYAWQSSHII